MIAVGIVANPASGRDIRRLVAHGSVFDNDEKVTIVRRVLLGLAATGVEQVWIMPDRFGIGPRALDGLRVSLAVGLLEMPAEFTQEDSRLAAGLLAERGVGSLVTLGGDGTNRAVAKASGAVPLLPISTGTNNVFPLMIEATSAGLAAGLVARGLAAEAVAPAPRIDVYRAEHDWGEPPAGAAPDDVALIDAAVYDEPFVGARAMWDAARIRELVLTRAEPGTIGLSAIGGHLVGDRHPAGHGLYLRLGAAGQRVRAPIAPGLIQTVEVADHRSLRPGEAVLLRAERACVLALDGEREIELRAGATVWLRLNADGPRVIDPRRAIALGVAAGVFG
jgi:hypothetical protein